MQPEWLIARDPDVLNGGGVLPFGRISLALLFLGLASEEMPSHSSPGESLQTEAANTSVFDFHSLLTPPNAVGRGI